MLCPAPVRCRCACMSAAGAALACLDTTSLVRLVLHASAVPHASLVPLRQRPALVTLCLASASAPRAATELLCGSLSKLLVWCVEAACADLEIILCVYMICSPHVLCLLATCRAFLFAGLTHIIRLCSLQPTLRRMVATVCQCCWQPLLRGVGSGCWHHRFLLL